MEGWVTKQMIVWHSRGPQQSRFCAVGVGHSYLRSLLNLLERRRCIAGGSYQGMASAVEFHDIRYIVSSGLKHNSFSHAIASTYCLVSYFHDDLIDARLGTGVVGRSVPFPRHCAHI